MASVKDPKAIDVISKNESLEKLKHSVSLLDTINKGLTDYLEKKRLFFPRFFFLSNDELLEILSETQDPLRVEPHLKKCFEGIRRLTFNQEKVIEGMRSDENEAVPFIKQVKPEEAHGLVEVWLQQVEESMRLSLKAEAVKAVDQHQKMKREEWISSFPGQILLATNIIYWTTEVTKVIQFA
jgi:dynein heavy chain